MLTLIHARHFPVSFPNTISVHLWVISVVCFQFSSCPYRRQLFGCEVSFPLISAAPNGEQRFSSTAFQTSDVYYPSGMSGWTTHALGRELQLDRARLARPDLLGGCAGAGYRACPETLQEDPPYASTSFGSTKTELLQFSQQTGDTGCDSRDGLSKVESRVRADRDTPKISPLRAANAEAADISIISQLTFVQAQEMNHFTLSSWPT